MIPNLSPQVIVFSFSKKECEALALQMAPLDLNDDSERTLVEGVFWNAVDSLGEDDRRLPQVPCPLPEGLGFRVDFSSFHMDPFQSQKGDPLSFTTGDRRGIGFVATLAKLAEFWLDAELSSVAGGSAAADAEARCGGAPLGSAAHPQGSH